MYMKALYSLKKCSGIVLPEMRKKNNDNNLYVSQKGIIIHLDDEYLKNESILDKVFVC